MSDRPVSLALLALLLLLLPANSCTRAVRPPDTAAINRAVSAAEATFRAMKARDYRGIWERLTSKSRERVADETLEALAKEGKARPGREELLADFRDGGPVARSYWDAFLAHFDPDTALADSRWEAADTGPGRVLILITYKTSDRPAALEMFLENGAWKFGLVETFWGR
ncbi:MAG: hypothetical protein ACM3NF_02570 [Gemmatimonadota bacterium]